MTPSAVKARVGASALVAGLTLAAASCGADTGDEATRGGQSPLITYRVTEPQPASGLSTEARLELREDCLYDGSVLILWPEGTTWDPGTQTVTLERWGGERAQIRAGEHFPEGLGAVSRQLGYLEEYLSDGARAAIISCLGDDLSADTELLVITPV